jgi:plasmid stability protein
MAEPTKQAQAACRARPDHAIISLRLISSRDVPVMPAVTIRKLSPQTHRALKARARSHGRSTEAEIRAILDAAVKPAEEIGIGSALAALGRRFRVVGLEITRESAPARPIQFK